MKTLIQFSSFIIVFNFFTISCLLAQEQTLNELPAKIEYKFTGIVENDFDSVFTVQVILDETDALNIKEVSYNLRKSNKAVKLDAKDKVKKEDKQVIIDLGTFKPTDDLNSIIFIDNNGKKLSPSYKR